MTVATWNLQSHPPSFPGRRIRQATGSVITTYTWDPASRLTGWQRGTSNATYSYDAAGQRTRAVVTRFGATTTTEYVYDGIVLRSLAATQGASNWRLAYLYDEEGRPYAGVYTSGTAGPITFLIATNDRGDVVALTSMAGLRFAHYTYDPYGNVLTATSNTVGGSINAAVAAAIAERQPLRYAGYVYDAHSQTYYLSQRHYDPATMRFLSKDPIRADGEESAYQYAAGDPVGKVDPTGLCAVVWSRSWFLKDLVRSGMAGLVYNYIWGRIFAGVRFLAETIFPRGTSIRNFFQGRVYNSWWFRHVRKGFGWLDRTVRWVGNTASHATFPFGLSYLDYLEWGTRLRVVSHSW